MAATLIRRTRRLPPVGARINRSHPLASKLRAAIVRQGAAVADVRNARAGSTLAWAAVRDGWTPTTGLGSVAWSIDGVFADIGAREAVTVVWRGRVTADASANIDIFLEGRNWQLRATSGTTSFELRVIDPDVGGAGGVTVPLSSPEDMVLAVAWGAGSTNFDIDVYKNAALANTTVYNRVANPENFSAASWSQPTGGLTLTSGASTPPVGYTTSTKIYPASSGSYRALHDSAAQVSSASGVFEIVAKAAGISWLNILASDGNSAGASFDLTNGVVGTVYGGTATITDLGGGWYLCRYFNTSGSCFAYFMPANADNSVSVTASGTNGIEITGAQLVAGTTPRAYQEKCSTTTGTRGAANPTTTLKANGTNNPNPLQTSVLLVFAGKLTADEVRTISSTLDKPWSIFEPRPLLAPLSAGGTTYASTLTATQAQTAALVRAVQAIRSASRSSAAALAKQAVLVRSASQAESVSLVKQAQGTRSATQAQSATAVRQAQLAKSATQAETASAVRTPGKVASASVTSSALLARALSATRSASQATSAALAKLAAVVRAAAQATTASAARTTRLTRSATQATTATVSRVASIIRSATQSASAVLLTGRLRVAVLTTTVVQTATIATTTIFASLSGAGSYLILKLRRVFGR